MSLRFHVANHVLDCFDYCSGGRLRAEANGAREDDQWLQPDDDEINNAMAEMDCGQDDRVSLQHFRQWWQAKGGWDFVRDPRKWI